MTDLLSDIDASSDAELISRVRGGDVAAYGRLFSRHVDAANRLGRQLARGPDVDDLVAEAFSKVLHVLQRGGGPDVAFRAYLLTSVRRLHVDKIRAGAKLQTSDDMSQFDPGIPFRDTAVAEFENSAAAKAFASLPERWQLVLWHLEVEGQKPAEIAPLLGMSANSVSALAYRAREGLRQAFLTMHLADTSAENCRWVNEHLGGYVRRGLSRRDTAKVDEHLDECRRCTAMYLELTEVNSNLAGIIAPLLLGAAAAGYLASSGTAVGTGLLALVGRARDTIGANAGVVTATAVAAGVAVVATGAFLISTAGSNDEVLGVDQPITVAESRSPGASPRAGSPSSEPRSSDPDITAGRSPSTTEGAVAPIAGSTSPAPSASGSTTGPGESPSSDPSTVPSTVPSADPSSQPTSTTGAGPAPSESATTTTPTPAPSESATTTTPTPAPSESATESPPTSTPPRESDLVMASASIVDGAVVIRVDGSPEMPPTLFVELASDPAGITFGPGGDCVVSLPSPSRALCTPTAPLVVAPFARAVFSVDGDTSTFEASIPLDIPNRQRATSLRVSVSAPEGFADPDDENNSAELTYTPAPLQADFAMSALEPTGSSDSPTFELTSNISGVPPDVEELAFDLTGNATFGAAIGNGADCALSQARVRCTNLSAAFAVTFVVTLPDNEPQDIRIELTVPPPYVDADTNNNARTITLKPDAGFDVVLDDLDYRRLGSFVRAEVSGVPGSDRTVRLLLSGQTKVTFTGGANGATGEGDVDCVVTSDRVATCTAASGAFHVDIDVSSREREVVSIEVVAEGVDEGGRTANNSREVTIGFP